ncbi:hypothetical protein [Streptomyces sp. Ag109_G2-15]|uniref:hypothetical protein n=1 Tax=Streptomyces sp. Ag109_G2-15 TaxID=1938850 RepID=UPI001180B158|nr:hypothetical protein [Streptomyces sp. Ag109_G2-15]
MHEQTSIETTLVFGASSSALVAIVYAPVAKLRQRGRELVDICHPLGPLAPDELADALDKRSRLESAGRRRPAPGGCGVRLPVSTVVRISLPK